jgi:hypothetical protein
MNYCCLYYISIEFWFINKKKKKSQLTSFLLNKEINIIELICVCMVSLLLLLIQTRTLQQIGKNVFIKMNERKKKFFFFLLFISFINTHLKIMKK